jgi:hypothetical protein
VGDGSRLIIVKVEPQIMPRQIVSAPQSDGQGQALGLCPLPFSGDGH